jgi:hypothetical protein
MAQRYFTKKGNPLYRVIFDLEENYPDAYPLAILS